MARAPQGLTTRPVSGFTACPKPRSPPHKRKAKRPTLVIPKVEADTKKLEPGFNLRSIASAVAIPIRPDSLSREACLVRSIVQQTRVKPNIFLSGSEQEPPTWPQAEIFYDFRAPIIQMEGMQRDEKVGICGEFFPRPDVPTCRIALRRMTQAVYRKLRRVESSADADLELIIGPEKRSAEFQAYLALLIPQQRHFTNAPKSEPRSGEIGPLRPNGAKIM